MKKVLSLLVLVIALVALAWAGLQYDIPGVSRAAASLPESVRELLSCNPFQCDGAASAADLLPLTNPAAPTVAYGLEHKNGRLLVRIAVAHFDDVGTEAGAQPAKEAKADPSQGIKVTLGLSATKTVRLASGEAKARATQVGGKAGVLFTFSVADSKVVDSRPDWEKLHLAFTVSWPFAAGANAPAGKPRQQETYLQNVRLSPHAALSDSPADWQLVSLPEFEKTMADRRAEIVINFEQPMEGKATIVIEDGQGQRVKNLISGKTLDKGPQRIVWDGTDEKGDIVPPGAYQWRSISHPGLNPHYLMSFADDQGSTHGTLHNATTNGKDVFLATSVSEGGYEVIQLKPDGAFVRGYNSPTGHGLTRAAVAADATHLYIAYDGAGWGEKVDYSKPDWKAASTVSLCRFELAEGKMSDFSRTERFTVLEKYEIGPGSPQKFPNESTVSNMVLIKGKLYLGDRFHNQILEIDAATGKLIRKLAIENPVALATAKDALYVVSGVKLVSYDLNAPAAPAPTAPAPAPAEGAAATEAPAAPASPIHEIATLEVKPRGPSAEGTAYNGAPSAGAWGAAVTGLALDADGNFYYSDPADQIVRILSPEGKPTGVIGHPGGVKVGKYDPLAFHNPAGLIVAPDGHLWVTEPDRWLPKRYAAFDVKTKTAWKEFFGPTAYGASSSGFDPEDHTKWIGQGVLFQLDFAKKTATPLSVLGAKDGRNYRYWRQDGRTFLISCGKVTWIQELLKDGSVKPLALITSAHQYAYNANWQPDQAFINAFKKAYPKAKYTYNARGYPEHGFGMMWVDKNGNGEIEEEEINFSTDADDFAGSGWSHDFRDLTLRVPARVGERMLLVAVKPDGFLPNGVPNYPTLNEALKTAKAMQGDETKTGFETIVDRFDNLLTNTTPMRSYNPEGKLLWTYPNKWVNVHGSHDAPLPSTGEMQGTLFFSGIAPLDDVADVTLLNGNHGRAFVITGDGLYLDEMFPDVRMMTNPHAGGIGILGGECFGGIFGRGEDGNYYFQGGGIEYRIYRIDGLRETVRQAGGLTVSPEQIVAAERARSRVLAAEAPVRIATIPWAAAPPDLDERKGEWDGLPAFKWQRGQFLVEVRARHDAANLYLCYTVRDGSPWRNTGNDWQMLFKTGDSVDLQLGTNPAANVKRSGPVMGDLRLLIAPFEGKNIAVLYRHRLPGAPDGVTFQCPWRSEKVDSVKRLEDAKIAVNVQNDRYIVKAAVPLAELGLAPNVFGKSLRCDVGVIYGDAAGTTNIFRNYWANQATGLVNDVPGEIMLAPNLWGDVTLEPEPAK